MTCFAGRFVDGFLLQELGPIEWSWSHDRRATLPGVARMGFNVGFAEDESVAGITTKAEKGMRLCRKCSPVIAARSK